jgi:quercetin dioxygenase-like cupin family protein
MDRIVVKNFSNPDEIRDLPKTKIEVVDFKPVDITVMHATLEPGWKWSECVKPTVHTDSCETLHIMYIFSGKLAIKLDNGDEKVLEPSDIVYIPAGHDAWVVGDEPCVVLDIIAGKFYGLHM